MKPNLTDILESAKSKEASDIETDIAGQAEQAQNNEESDHNAFLERCNTADLYYAAQLPGPTTTDEESESFTKRVNGKEYVEPVLRTTVENAKTQLLDSFTSDQSLAVAFRSRDFRRDPTLERVAEHNMNKYFLRDQDGYQKVEQGIHNIVVRGGQFTKVYPDVYAEHEKEEVGEWVELISYLQSLAEDWTIDFPPSYETNESGEFKGFEWKKETIQTIDPQTMQPIEQELEMIQGTIPLIKVVKGLVIENCSPADIWCDTSLRDFKKARHIMHRTYTTLGEALKRGYDPEKLKKATDTKLQDDLLPQMYFSQVNYTDPVGGGRLERTQSLDPNEQPISIDEHYLYSSIPHPENETRLYQVKLSGGEVLGIKEIPRMPFVFGKMEDFSDTFFGGSLFDRAKPFQDSLSLAQRISQRMAKLAAWPRYQAVQGAFDRQSLMSNRPGVVVQVASIGSVQEFPQQQLPASFFETYNALRESATEALVQPINVGSTDGQIPQVSTATISLKLFNDAQKGMAISKTIARTYIEPLIQLCYEIIRDENFKLETEDGQPFYGSQLPKSGDWIIDINTSNDDMAQALQLTNIVNFIGQMSQYNSPIFNDANKLQAARFLLERFDFDPQLYTTDPAQNQDPHAAQEQAEVMFIQSELAKNQLVTATLNNRKLAADIWDTETKATERIKDGESGRAIKANDPQLLIAQIRKDVENNIRDNQTKVQEIAVKNKAVDREFLLGAAKHATDITSPQINGIR